MADKPSDKLETHDTSKVEVEEELYEELSTDDQIMVSEEKPIEGIFIGKGRIAEVKLAEGSGYDLFPATPVTVENLDSMRALEQNNIPFTGDDGGADVSIADSVGCIGSAGWEASSFCVAHDTRVLTTKGEIKISNLKEGVDEVMTCNGPVKISRVIKIEEEREVFELVAKSPFSNDVRRVEATADHKIAFGVKKSKEEYEDFNAKYRTPGPGQMCFGFREDEYNHTYRELGKIEVGENVYAMTKVEDGKGYVNLYEVISIEPKGKKEVLDISVPGEEYFVANGIIVHNCR